MIYTVWILYVAWRFTLCFVGALLCVLGFVSAIIVSTLDKVGMKQLGLDGAIQEESRKVACVFVFNLILASFCSVFDALIYLDV